MSQHPPAEAAPIFAALGDETRLHLVTRLSREGPMSITQLTAGGRVTRQAVTKHLHVLADAGIAHSRLRGRERLWELDSEALQDARAYLDRVSAQWDVALDRLRQVLEGTSPTTTVGESLPGLTSSPSPTSGGVASQLTDED